MRLSCTVHIGLYPLGQFGSCVGVSPSGSVRTMIVGRGRCAELYALSDSQVLKLYEPRFERDRVDHYATVGARVHAAGIRTPEITGVISQDDRFGLVMERVSGTTLWEAIRVADDATVLGRHLAELHADIHSNSISGLVSKIDEVAERVERRASLNPAAVAEARRVIESGRRDDHVLVHGDLHPANVMVDETGQLISIDWDGAQTGPAALDVARGYFLIADWAVAPGTEPVDPAVRHAVATAYVDHYVDITGIAKTKIEQWYVPLSLARYGENVTEEIPLLDAFVQGEQPGV